MQVYQTNLDGVFIGAVLADPSPLEPDVWLIPAGCVKVAPPAFGDGQFARWTGAAWVVEDIPAPPEPEPAPEPTPTLNRAQWYVLLNSSPFGFILDAVIADMPDGPQKVAFKAVAYESEGYSLANTLAIVAGMRAQGVSGLPTDAEIEAGWAVAAQFKGAADLLGGE